MSSTIIIKNLGFELKSSFLKLIRSHMNIVHAWSCYSSASGRNTFFWFALRQSRFMLQLMISWILYGPSLSKWIIFQISRTYYSIWPDGKVIQYTLSASINSVRYWSYFSHPVSFLDLIHQIWELMWIRGVVTHHQLNQALWDKSEACVEMMRQLHGNRVYAVNRGMLIIPLGSFVYFQIPSFVWFGIGAMFVLALAKWEITWDVIKKMDTALCWQKHW